MPASKQKHPLSVFFWHRREKFVYRQEKNGKFASKVYEYMCAFALARDPAPCRGGTCDIIFLAGFPIVTCFSPGWVKNACSKTKKLRTGEQISGILYLSSVIGKKNS